MSEKTEKATPYKLQKAKEKGQVAKSNELNTVITFLIFLGVFLALWQTSIQSLLELFRKILVMSATPFDSLDQFHSMFWSLHQVFIVQWLPFALTIILTIVLSSIAQSGFVWSAKPLHLDFTRLNPLKGFKKIYSVRMIFDFGKNVFKLITVLCTAAISFYYALPQYVNLTEHTPPESFSLIVNLIIRCLFQILLVLLVIAILDAFFTRWKYLKDNRMSKQEVKDEYRNREGDPKIKQKIKQLQRQLLMNISSLGQVKKADVVITNPTHIAIALQYKRGQMPAPKLLCKARGDLAWKVRRIAQQHQIPVIEHKVLARQLMKEVSLNQTIKPTHFRLAAEVFRVLYASREVHPLKQERL